MGTRENTKIANGSDFPKHGFGLFEIEVVGPEIVDDGLVAFGDGRSINRVGVFLEFFQRGEIGQDAGDGGLVQHELNGGLAHGAPHFFAGEELYLVNLYQRLAEPLVPSE